MAWLLGQAARCLLAGARTTQLVIPWSPPAIGAAYVAAAPIITTVLGPHWQPQEHRLVQACRGLCVSACRWDKHAAQKEAFLKMLEDSKKALKKLDRQIQDMLPPKQNAKNQLQKMGDQLATKMDSMSKDYMKEAQKLTGQAKKEMEAAGKKLKMEADKLRKQNGAIDSTAKSINKNTKAALEKAKEINNSVMPQVKKQMDKAALEGRKMAAKTQSEAKKIAAKSKKQSKKFVTKTSPPVEKPVAKPLTEKLKKLQPKKKDPAAAKKGAADMKKKTKGFTVKLKTWGDAFCDKFALFRKKAAVKMKEQKKKAKDKTKKKKEEEK